MGDPAKDYYQERLVQAAWGQLSAAVAAGGYAPHHGLDPSAHGQVGGYATHPSYLHQLQQNFSHLTQPPSQQQQHAGYDPPQNPNKNIQRVPNGGQASAYNYSADQFHRPLPAHSSMPNASARTGAPPALPIPAPMPAHMRSHPYQPSSYSHLTAPYNHYQGYPYHTPSAPVPSEKHPLTSASHSQALNGNNSSSYYQPPSDPKDFSRSRGSTEKAAENSGKNLTSSQQQQQLMSKASTTSSYTYPYESMPTSVPYNYHQNLYSGQQPQYSLPYPSIHRPPTTVASPAAEVHKAAVAAKEGQSKSSYSTNRPSFESEKPSSYNLLDSVPRSLPSDLYNSNHSLNQRSDIRSGNGYPPTSEVSNLTTTLQQQNSSIYSAPQTSAPSYMPDAHLQSSYSPSQYSTTMTYQNLSVAPQPQQQHYHPQPDMPPSTPVNQSHPEAVSGKEPGGGGKKSEKRKSTSKSSEPKQKYFKKDERANNKNSNLPSKDDPYAFNDDEEGSTAGGGNGFVPPKDAINNFPDFSRFGKEKSAQLAAGPVYKFKNALLTRTTETLQQLPSSSPGMNKSNPLNFNSTSEAFVETCQKFIEDLQTKQFQVSRRASMESWRNTMAVRAAEKERKKSQKMSKKDSNNDSKSFDDSTLNNSFAFQQTNPDSTPYSERFSVEPNEPQFSSQPYQQYPNQNFPSQQFPTTIKDDFEFKSVEAKPPTNIQSQIVKETAEIPSDVKSKIDLVCSDNKVGLDQPIPDEKPLQQQQQHNQISNPASQNNNETTTLIKPESNDPIKNPPTTTNGKKGQLWALPIVPKLPQKPVEKRPNSLGLVGLPAASVVKKVDPASADPVESSLATQSATSGASSNPGAGPPLADVWRQAFGAAKPKKPNEIVAPGNGRTPKQEPGGAEVVIGGAAKKNEKTYLDIPPEIRRRPKPVFGGLIHFSPDWERSVRQHHEHCKLPQALTKNIQVHPKILSSSQQPLVPSSTPSATVTPAPTPSSEPKTPSSASATQPGSNKYATLSSYLGSPSDSSDTDHTSPTQTAGPSLSDAMINKNVVETILENRKKLRMSVAIGRMFRLPVTPEKKRYNSKGTTGVAVRQSKRSIITGLMPTPGMPLWMETTDHATPDESNSPQFQSSNPFGNFRRQTLLRYLSSLNCSPEIKARMLDWKPEVYETKTRRQAHQVKAVSSVREIFGSDPPVKASKKAKRKRVSSGQSSQNSSPVKKEADEDSPQIKKIKITKDSPQKVSNKKEKQKVEEAVDTIKKEKDDSKESKKSPKKDGALRETTNVSKRSQPETPLKKESKAGVVVVPILPETSKLRAALIKEEPLPEIKTEAQPEPKKERKKRKPKVVVAEPPPVDTALEESIKETALFSCGGAASGAMAAAALAAEAAALKALEKEKPFYKRTPKKLKLKQDANDDSDSDGHDPSEVEENLQKELQNFALDLLEENPSWEKRKIIQNLVIWEFVPVDPSLLPPQPLLANPVLVTPQMKPPPKRKGKKMRKYQSGLDFAKKKTPGKNSRCVSRATTPDISGPEEVHDITYTLDHLLAETGRWVIDKSAGETILHRAAKMGYPDAAAYALDMAKMSPTMKDNAGIPPIHKAAFRGHADIVEYLLRYGADPNTNVKGTRPLHEALEKGNLESVYHLLCHGADPLLYDYSGNMPIDLAEENEEMLFYFSNILNDLHGRKGARWNVSHKSDFVMPQSEEIEDSTRSESPTDFEFEVSNRMPPPFYQLSDREGRFILAADFKASTSIDVSKQASKHDVVELNRDEFLRLGRCCDLGVKPNPEIFCRDKVILVKFDSNIKKLLDKSDSAAS